MLSFETFMARALHDPQSGYYAQRATVGQSGDFSTSATLCPAFAEAIAHWLQAVAARLQLATPWPVIELGPGSGHLASGLHRILGTQIDLHLVETSSPLREAQRQHLGSTPHRHHTTLSDTLRQTQGTGLIIANEFADSFPAIQLLWHENAWHAVFIETTGGGQAREHLQPFDRRIDAEAPTHPRPGQRLFIHPSYHSWLRDNLPTLRRGAMLTIDYGAASPSRECRAYQGQRRYEGSDIYQHPGQRDITCDINFSDIQRWSEALGLRTLSLTTQRDFLLHMLPGAEQRATTDSALAYLLQPLGPGGAFLALTQEKS